MVLVTIESGNRRRSITCLSSRPEGFGEDARAAAAALSENGTRLAAEVCHGAFPLDELLLGPLAHGACQS